MTERITAAEFKAGETPRKYRNEPVTVRGIRFDSKREANRWLVLCQMERDGEIRDLRRQVPIMLQGRDGPMMSRTGRQMRLTVDFSYVERKTGLTIYEDAKGKPTRDYEVRRAAAAAQGIEVLES